VSDETTRRRAKKMARQGSTPATVAAQESESERIYAWRFKTLTEAGMPSKLAMRVADSEADLHQAVELLGAGCSPELVADIVT